MICPELILSFFLRTCIGVFAIACSVQETLYQQLKKHKSQQQISRSDGSSKLKLKNNCRNHFLGTS